MEVATAFDNIDNIDRPIVTRAQARASGLTRYFTGKPCPKGHVTQKSTAVDRCVECVRIAQRVANMTPEQRERTNAKQRRANMTPEKVARLKELARNYYTANKLARAAATVEGKQP